MPIFKTIDVEAVKAANSGLMPESTAFLQVSNLTGMDLLDRIEAGGRSHSTFRSTMQVSAWYEHLAVRWRALGMR